MIIPSIDLMNGKAVQLKQGKEKILEREDVFGLAEKFARFGEIAVIDLDAALEKGGNSSLIYRLCQRFPVRVGGGIRSVERAMEIFRAGAEKIIVGSAALSPTGLNEEFLTRLVEKAGKERVIIALDVVDDKVMIRGWQEATSFSIGEILPHVGNFATEILVTDIRQEGTMQGIRQEFYRKLQESTSVRITAAGGVGSPADIQFFGMLGMNVQLGMIIYTGAIALEEAFIHGLNWKNELIPTIVRDTSGKILMLAYSNRQSLRKTFETNTMWYYSRSRQSLWNKGATSGNVQIPLQFRVDCDNDTLLVTVHQTGGACHTGKYSCFDENPFQLQDLYRIIRERLDNPVPGSYTATLTPEKTAAKILEEAEEVVRFTDRDNLVWELGDLLYFVSVLMVQQGIEWKEVLQELRKRRFK